MRQTRGLGRGTAFVYNRIVGFPVGSIACQAVSGQVVLGIT